MEEIKSFLVKNRKKYNLYIYDIKIGDIKYGEYFAKINARPGYDINFNLIFTQKGILYKERKYEMLLEYEDIGNINSYSINKGSISSKNCSKVIILNGVNFPAVKEALEKIIEIKKEKDIIKFSLFKKFDNIINYSKKQKLNILFVGGTGVGKSSTINALFGRYEAEVGVGQNPETTEIGNYNLENITIWDSPGLGDSSENDRRYADQIKTLLQRKNENNEFIIDMVLVIVDGSSRQLESTYKLIKEVLVPNINKEKIIIGINKIDKAIGKYWDSINNCPKLEVREYIKNSIVKPIEERIEKDTGIRFSSIIYTAGEMNPLNNKQDISYNINNLFYNILISIVIDN